MDRAQELRHHWTNLATGLATPVLSAIANQRLRETMPVEARPGHLDGRRKVTHLEAVARLLAGVSPWLATGESPELATMAQQAIRFGTDPTSPDYFNFTNGGQPLVDAAFLAHAILRAPDLLWKQLDAATKRNVIAALKITRAVKPPFNNWLLFSAMIEAFLATAGEEWDAARVDHGIRQHMAWYKGDSAYGDGPSFHFDYYNSYVIQPMLLDVLAVCSKHRADWNEMQVPIVDRAKRFAVVQERMIAPDGSFPAVGRSLAYRCGAFQHLAQMALQHELPAELPPAQVRGALSAVIDRTLCVPGTFDAAGWLRVGLSGHQPSLAEPYISTGSLYLCATAFLPLGLPASDPFWNDPSVPFTGQKAWGGVDLPADHALDD